MQQIFAELFEEINQAIPDPALCVQVYQRLTGFFQAKLNELWAAKSARRDPRRARRLLDRFANSSLDIIKPSNPDPRVAGVEAAEPPDLAAPPRT